MLIVTLVRHDRAEGYKLSCRDGLKTCWLFKENKLSDCRLHQTQSLSFICVGEVII